MSHSQCFPNQEFSLSLPNKNILFGEVDVVRDHLYFFNSSYVFMYDTISRFFFQLFPLDSKVSTPSENLKAL